jgi:hypothetical protein
MPRSFLHRGRGGRPGIAPETARISRLAQTPVVAGKFGGTLKGSVRIGGVILGVLALLWAFLQAPFDHIHPEELEHQATSAPVHLHVHETFTGHGPFIGPRTADDDEVDVLWSAATSANVVLHADAELGDRVPLRDPSPASVALLVPRHRGHDPPESSPKIPRAPPA